MANNTQRLRQSADIRRCFNDNKRLVGPLYTVFWSKKKQDPRLCVVVSKKTSKLAVQRNRIRRIAKEAFRCFDQPLFGDMVILARYGGPKASNSELRLCIDTLLTKVARYQAD